MDAPLTPEVLASLREHFKSDKKNSISQNAIAKNGIISACFSHERSTGHVHVYNHSVEEIKPITNQKSSGRCWIFALMNTIRVPFAKKHNLTTMEFSQTHLYFWNKVERSNYLIELYMQTAKEPLDGRLMMFLLNPPCQDGGQWDMLVNVVEKYGLVPKDYWPDTNCTEASRKFNDTMSLKLREACLSIRKLAAEGKSVEEMRKTKEKFLKEVYQICCVCLGTPLDTFDWEYYDKDKKYHCHDQLTPLKFYQELVKPVFNMEDKVCLINDPRDGHDYYNLYTVQYLINVVGGHPVRYINAPIDVLKKAAAASIKDSEAVWFGCDVGKSYQKCGLLDLNAVDYDLVLNVKQTVLDKGERLQYGESLMTHAMVLTAVHEKQTDAYTRWRVENSWGSDNGKDGYLLMTDQWFTEYVYEVVIDRKYITDDKLDHVMKKEPIVLPPWDPMGSLAIANVDH